MAEEEQQDSPARGNAFGEAAQAPAPPSSASDEEMSDSSIELERATRVRASPPSPPASVQDLPDRDMLAAKFITAWNNFDDSELQQLILRRYMKMISSSRPSMDEVRERAIDILRLIGPRLEPRDAIILLLQAGLDQALAVQQWMQLSHPRLATTVAEARDPPSAKELAKGK
ncbi:MAG: hypothetical protein Q9184_005770 [Pyrenodesmia sp. 2 TL-2023]